MVWKKTWPSQLKEKLKRAGLSDGDIKALEDLGSLAAFMKDKRGELHKARKKALEAALAEAGL